MKCVVYDTDTVSMTKNIPLSRPARDMLYDVREQYKYAKYNEVYETVEKRFEEERESILEKYNELGKDVADIPETDPKEIKKITEMLLDKVSTKQILLMAQSNNKEVLKLFNVEMEETNETE